MGTRSATRSPRVQQGAQRRRSLQRRAQAAADHQEIHLRQMRQLQLCVGTDHQPQVAGDRLATQAEGLGREAVRIDQVGRDHGVECLGVGRQGEMLEQQKTYPSLLERFFPVLHEAQVLPLHGFAETTSG